MGAYRVMLWTLAILNCNDEAALLPSRYFSHVRIRRSETTSVSRIYSNSKKMYTVSVKNTRRCTIRNNVINFLLEEKKYNFYRYRNCFRDEGKKNIGLKSRWNLNLCLHFHPSLGENSHIL